MHLTPANDFHEVLRPVNVRQSTTNRTSDNGNSSFYDWRGSSSGQTARSAMGQASGNLFNQRSLMNQTSACAEVPESFKLLLWSGHESGGCR